jgi:hypothetical protein
MTIKWIAGAALLVSTGGLVACGAASPTAGATTPPPSVTTTAPSDDATTGVGSAPTPTSAPASAPVKRPTAATAPPKNPILKGQRQIAIVRVQATESAVSLLDSGELAEVDDDSGKTLFVLSPLTNGRYLIRTAELDKATNGSQACWQVRTPAKGGSLTVRKAVCDPDSARQQFTITARGKQAYAISNRSAFLQYSPKSGLILEELGDAKLTTTFTFADNGAAPAVD